jgi:hypothetical protein
VDVNEGEVAALVAGGYFPEEARGDPAAIKAAIEVVISDMALRASARDVDGERISSMRAFGGTRHGSRKN